MLSLSENIVTQCNVCTCQARHLARVTWVCRWATTDVSRLMLTLPTACKSQHARVSPPKLPLTMGASRPPHLMVVVTIGYIPMALTVMQPNKAEQLLRRVMCVMFVLVWQSSGLLHVLPCVWCLYVSSKAVACYMCCHVCDVCTCPAKQWLATCVAIRYEMLF